MGHGLERDAYHSGKVTVQDAAGNLRGLNIDANGAVALGSIVPGTAATNLGKAEDAAHASGDVGVAALTVRQDTAAALGGADGDYQPIISDANGRTHVIEASAAAILADTASIDAALSGAGAPVVDSFASAVVDLAASGADQEMIAAPAADKQIWVYGLFIAAGTAEGTLVLQDEDDTAFSGTMAIADTGSWVLPMSGNFAMPWIKVTTAKALEGDTGAATLDGIIVYAIVDVS